MERDKTFRIKYEVDDGYVGGSRPHHVTVTASDVEGMNDKEIREVFHDEIRRHFLENIRPVSEDEDAFVEWALSVQPDEEE